MRHKHKEIVQGQNRFSVLERRQYIASYSLQPPHKTKKTERFTVSKGCDVCHAAELNGSTDLLSHHAI